jgi:CheY-like chemotaxis protein
MSENGLRVVYAEDDELVRATVSEMLNELGAEVHVCRNGAEAVLLCLSVAPRVALLDLTMLGMDGFGGAARIRANDPERRIRLVALTGLRADYAREQALKAGFDEFLSKPITLEALGVALDRWMS